jgi:uncharacterized membrane protein
MISNHYPLAYATRFSWLILALVLVIGGLVRHFYNVRHRRQPSPWWTWGLAALCGLAIIWLSALGPAIEPPRKRADVPPAVAAFREVEAIVTSRCSMCHAKEPVWAQITVAPKGVLLDTAAHIKANARAIAIAAVWSNAMPPSNVTSMTREEREVLAAWANSSRQ